MNSFGGPELLVILFGLFGLLSTIFWIWMLVDCITKEPAEGNERIIWVVVIALVGPLGALIYLLARRPQRIALHGR